MPLEQEIIALLSKRIASFFRKNGGTVACACTGTPPCFRLDCVLVWKELLEKPEILTKALDLYSVTHEILEKDYS